MAMQNINLCVFTFLVLIPISQSQGEEAQKTEFGSVRGRVIDSKKQPVSGAQVRLYNPQLASPVPRQTQSHADGSFELERVLPGKYYVIARKESSGFANTIFSFLAVGTPPMLQVEVNSGQQIGPVVIDVGKPHGRLVCRAISAVSGAPVAVRVRFSLVDSPQISLTSAAGSDGRFEEVVPGVPITIEINDFKGVYQTFRATDITVAEETTKEMIVKLVPKVVERKP